MRQILAIIFLGIFTSLVLAQNAWINEIHYDNFGTDVDEFVEIVIENAGSYTLSEFSVTLYNGNNNSVYDTKTLDQFTPGTTEGDFTFYHFMYPSNGIQNGAPDGLSLNYQGSLIPGQFLSYEGTMTASGGPANGVLSQDIGVAEPGPVGKSLQLGGSGQAYSSFFWQDTLTATPGAINQNQELSSVINPEPGHHVTNFSTSAITGYSITLTWTGAIGEQLPGRYLILGKTGDGTFAEVRDSTPVADDSDWSDGNVSFNVIHKDGANSLLVSGLDELTAYDFRIYPYTNSGEDINYKTDGEIPETSGTTTSLELSAISEIRQNMSTYTGQVVKVSGTITHVRSGNGFYLQDAVTPWSGIYVFDRATVANFTLADSVIITGLVEEYNDLSEITSLTAWTIVEQNVDLPEPILVATGDFAQEQYESMLMRIENAECVSAPNEYLEWDANDGSGICIVDDYLYSFVPVVGAFYNLTGICNYFQDYKLEPRSAADVELITNAPKITQVGISARVPMADEAFIDTVKIIALSPVLVAELRYMVNGDDTNISAVTLIPMPGDTLFYGEIPATAYGDGDAVEYWVYAEDTNGEMTEGEHRGFFAGATPLGSLHQLDENNAFIYDGFYAKSKGIATVGNGVFDTEHLNVYMQDEAFGAVNVFKYDAAAVAVIPGYEYEVIGVAEQYNGLIQLTPDDAATDITDLGEKTMPEAIPVNIATLLAGPEALEGLLIKIEYADTLGGGEAWPASGSNANLIITDDAGVSQLTLRIDKDTDIDEHTEPVWPQHVTGIFSQYDFSSPYTTGYQIIARSFADFDNATALDDDPGQNFVVNELVLYPAYPNPFNPNTTLRFNLPVRLLSDGQINLAIFNILGQKIKSFSNNSWKAGINTINWDARSDAGQRINSGIYYAVLTAGGKSETVKLVLLK